MSENLQCPNCGSDDVFRDEQTQAECATCGHVARIDAFTRKYDNDDPWGGLK